MMNYSLTVFKSIYDNTINKKVEFENFSELENLLYSLSRKKGYKAKKNEKGKQSSPLISPAYYEENSKRRNAHVLGWAGWCAVDIDEYEGDYKDLLKQYENYYYICYSSASSKKSHPKFRLVFPLNRHVMKDEIKHFWFALNKELGDVADPQTKDLSRMYYVPAQYPNAFNFIFTNKGTVMDIDEIMAKHEYVESRNTNSFLDKLPESIRTAILKDRKNKMTNTNISWSSYSNCPFVPKNMIEEYKSIAFTDGSGRYLMIYKIMVSIACNAIKMNYPIREGQIVDLVKELDRETSNRYHNRPLHTEAKRALEYALSQSYSLQI